MHRRVLDVDQATGAARRGHAEIVGCRQEDAQPGRNVHLLAAQQQCLGRQPDVPEFGVRPVGHRAALAVERAGERQPRFDRHPPVEQRLFHTELIPVHRDAGRGQRDVVEVVVVEDDAIARHRVVVFGNLDDADHTAGPRVRDTNQHARRADGVRNRRLVSQFRADERRLDRTDGERFESGLRVHRLLDRHGQQVTTSTGRHDSRDGEGHPRRPRARVAQEVLQHVVRARRVHPGRRVQSAPPNRDVLGERPVDAEGTQPHRVRHRQRQPRDADRRDRDHIQPARIAQRHRTVADVTTNRARSRSHHAVDREHDGLAVQEPGRGLPGEHLRRGTTEEVAEQVGRLQPGTRPDVGPAAEVTEVRRRLSARVHARRDGRRHRAGNRARRAGDRLRGARHPTGTERPAPARRGNHRFGIRRPDLIQGGGCRRLGGGGIDDDSHGSGSRRATEHLREQGHPVLLRRILAPAGVRGAGAAPSAFSFVPRQSVV